ncbi:MAG: 3-methyl-2-oxobutanoate hydroxymethyltransferase [Actinomycetota bacterium]|nr:3-methyl-2-oxobutanoate hydroxymethyltransferase [Actinomycetota bacterium]
MKERVTITRLAEMKARGEKITMLTAYDYPSAQIIDSAGVDVILVGDSLGMVILGHDSTLSVTMDDMIHHTKAVARGAESALIVGDMPFMSYQASVDEALKNAARFLSEAGAQAVKLEGGKVVAEKVDRMTSIGIPVMGHLGLTPQSVNQFGGYKVQGREEKAKERIIKDAKALEEAGAFAIVLECIPSELASVITEKVMIPTIGIGAGPTCDGQVLVTPDLIGTFDKFTPKFVKRFGAVGAEMRRAFEDYVKEVKEGKFPGPEHEFK